ncbi:hypothetical protein [Kitasatospora sp. NPDC059827]
MSGRRRQTAGRRSLQRFWCGVMAGSGYGLGNAVAAWLVWWVHSR